jgi:hypothetical protein
MLSKCANPECSEQFRYLLQGKLFHLTPTPEVEQIIQGSFPSLYERFWLCERCSKEMTVIWDGWGPKIVPLPAGRTPAPQSPGWRRPHHAFTGRDVG